MRDKQKLKHVFCETIVEGFSQRRIAMPSARMHSGLKWFEIDAFTFHRMSERATEQMSATERTGDASSAEQATDRAVRANERVNERAEGRMAQ